MPVSPEAVVDPPPSVPPCHGLLDSAVRPEEPEGSRWESGFVFQPENCIEAEAWRPCATCRDAELAFAVCATGGTFTLTVGEFETDPIPWDADAAQLAGPFQEAVDELFGPGQAFATVAPEEDFFIISINGPAIEAACAGEPIVVDDLGADISNLESDCKFPVLLVVAQEPGLRVDEKKSYDGKQEPVEYAPFIIEVPYECSSFGFQAADYESRALRQIDAAKGKALEFEFWTGQKDPDNLNLVYGTPNDDDHVLNPGGAAAPIAVSPGLALVLLAQALSNCATGSRGMIHATTGLAERWGQLGQIHPDGNLLVTKARCDVVVSGAGYPGTGPIGQPPPGPNEVWAYATGMVAVRLGEVMLIPESFEEAFDRRTNTVTYRGEVTASAVYDGCCSFAVLVDVCGTD